MSEASAPTVNVWDLSTGAAISSFAHPAGTLSVDAAALSPDGNILISGGSTDPVGRKQSVDYVAKNWFWDLRSGRLLSETVAGYYSVATLKLAPDGKANAALFKIFPLMFLAMLTILMLQLQRFSTLFLVFSTAPLGLIGASFALLAFDAPFGFNALLGLIALAGMIMRNTVILVDQIDADVASGLSRWDAIIESTVRRSRPLVLTAMAAILAMIPLSRSVFWGPMAITMMGGLLVATILTLLFLPALYAAWFRVRRPKAEATILLPQAQEPVGSSPVIAIPV